MAAWLMVLECRAIALLWLPVQAPSLLWAVAVRLLGLAAPLRLSQLKAAQQE